MKAKHAGALQAVLVHVGQACMAQRLQAAVEKIAAAGMHLAALDPSMCIHPVTQLFELCCRAHRSCWSQQQQLTNWAGHNGIVVEAEAGCDATVGFRSLLGGNIAGGQTVRALLAGFTVVARVAPSRGALVGDAPVVAMPNLGETCLGVGEASVTSRSSGSVCEEGFGTGSGLDGLHVVGAGSAGCSLKAKLVCGHSISIGVAPNSLVPC